MITNEILHSFTDRHFFSAYHQPKSDSYAYVVECFVKVNKGIHYLIRRCDLEEDALDINTHIFNTLHDGYFSIRPYAPGQACDGTINATTSALLIDFCEKNPQFDYIALHKIAYPDSTPVTKQNINSIKDFANWQGVDYPFHWDSDNIPTLIQSLRNVNYGSLAEIIEEALITYQF